MGDFYLGEIRVFPYGKTPQGWLPCDGRMLPITQYTALYSLIWTNYGGDGRSTFALPDLQGRAAVAPQYNPLAGPLFRIGQTAGEESHTLLAGEVPGHTHTAQCSTLPGTASAVAGAIWAAAATEKTVYGAPASTPVSMNGSAAAAAGGDLAHNNLQPYLALNYCIAVTGIYPPHT